MAHKSKGTILNHAMSRLNADVDRKEPSEMPDSPDSYPDPTSNYAVGQTDNPKFLRPIEAGDLAGQKKTSETTAEDESPDGKQRAAVGGLRRYLSSPGSQ